jgi:hypothetical protein
MTQLILQRIDQNTFATYGNLTDAENKQLCVTLERPWLDNQHEESCIPVGSYTFTRFHSPHWGYDVFKSEDVPGRGAIELHIGNLPHDSEGCILLGSNFGTVNGQHGITGSAAAFARFMSAMHGVDSFTLDVLAPVPLLAH